MFTNKESNFILQQGYGESCSRYGPLQFQPRLVGALFLLGVFFQAWPVFLLLAALLGWSAWRPHQNPFEALYNRTLARRPGAEPIPPAPSPRRFAQGMAATMTFLISVCLFFNRPLWAYLLELIMGAALVALILFGFCLGSVVYHALHDRWDFAKRTFPWA